MCNKSSFPPSFQNLINNMCDRSGFVVVYGEGVGAGVGVGEGVGEGGQGRGLWPRERWRSAGRVKSTSGRSDIRLLSIKITLVIFVEYFGTIIGA